MVAVQPGPGDIGRAMRVADIRGADGQRDAAARRDIIGPGDMRHGQAQAALAARACGRIGVIMRQPAWRAFQYRSAGLIPSVHGRSILPFMSQPLPLQIWRHQSLNAGSRPGAIR